MDNLPADYKSSCCSDETQVKVTHNGVQPCLNDITLIFVHPPRTAGTTLSRIMHWEYSPLHVCDIDGRFYYWSLQKVSGWPKERLARMKVFNGHIPFGLHRFIPQPTTYITILRDPVNRTISEYYAHRHRRTHPIIDRDAKRLSLEEYVAQVSYNNPQTKAIAGVDVPYHYHFYTLRPSYHFYTGPCTAETLATAKENLSRYFSLVGLTERLEETLALAKVLFGWKIPCFTYYRRSEHPRREDVPPRLRALIAEHNQFDMELYKFGVSLFDRTIAERAEQVSLELNAIRRARNRGPIRQVYHRCGSFILRHFIRARCAM
jgi:hypothetical protein